MNIKLNYLLVPFLLISLAGNILFYSKIGELEEKIQKISQYENQSSPVEKDENQDQKENTTLWKKYTNSQLGFSINVPDKVYGHYSCDPKKAIEVPVKVFEDNESGVVYISQEYYYNSKYDSELDRHVGECKKIIYSLELFRNEHKELKNSFSEWSGGFKPFLGWTIMVKTVKNEDELDKFIKENYGPGCFAGDKKSWKLYQQSGVYDIHIRGESDNQETNLGTTSCVGAWTARHKVLYFPEENKVMSVILGQEPTFWNNPHTPPYQAYDGEMIDSFRFK